MSEMESYLETRGYGEGCVRGMGSQAFSVLKLSVRSASRKFDPGFRRNPVVQTLTTGWKKEHVFTSPIMRGRNSISMIELVVHDVRPMPQPG